MYIFVHIFWEWEIFQTEVVEKIKTHFFSVIFFFEIQAVYLKNVENNSGAGGATDDNMGHGFSCRAPQATTTHSEYVILIAFPQQQWLH